MMQIINIMKKIPPETNISAMVPTMARNLITSGNALIKIPPKEEKILYRCLFSSNKNQHHPFLQLKLRYRKLLQWQE